MVNDAQLPNLNEGGATSGQFGRQELKTINVSIAPKLLSALGPALDSSVIKLRNKEGDGVVVLPVKGLLVDVHPQGPRDPQGIHGALLNEVGTEDYVLTGASPLTAVAYVGGVVVEAFIAHFAVGEPLPPMPLFLTRENYVNVPLEAAYLAAWEDVPPQYQEVLRAIPESSEEL